MNQSKWLFHLKIAVGYTLAKLKFLHFLLPKQVKEQLPSGWNDHMFWTAFKSGGQKIYADYYCQLREPDSYQPKVVVDEPYRLSEAEIRFFYENGYLGPFNLISSEEAKSLKEHFTEMLARGESPIYPYSQGGFEIESKANSERDGESNFQQAYKRIMNNRDRYLDNPRLLNLFKNPGITERCAQLLGSDLMLWRTEFFIKQPGSPGTPLHQATTYLSDDLKESAVYPSDVEELFQVTCWVALTNATKENGCMKILPGSHKNLYPILFPNQEVSNTNDSRKKLSALKIDYPIESSSFKPIELKAGQFFILSERLIHGAYDNTTENQWRWAANGRIVCPDTRIYSKKRLKEGHSFKIANAKNLKLDNWKAVMIRGKDRFGYNRMLEESVKAKGEAIYVN